MLKHLLRPLAVASVAVLLVACSSVQAPPAGSASASPATGGTRHKITMVPGNTRDFFYITMSLGAKAEAELLGVDLTWQGAPAHDPAEQIPLLNAVRATKPELLILTPANKEALVQTAREFQEDGIPILTVDGDLADTSLRIGHITTDNKLGGRLAADFLASVIDEGSVIYLGKQPGATPVDNRWEGFEEQVATHPNLKYLGPEINNDDRAEIVAQVSAVLQRNPDLAGIFAGTDQQGLGAAVAIKNAGLSGKVNLVTFDADPTLVEGIKNGEITALVAQHAYEMGRASVRSAVAYLDGGVVPEIQLFPGVIVTKDNVDDPSLGNVLYRDE